MPIETPNPTQRRARTGWVRLVLMAMLVVATACGSSDAEIAVAGANAEQQDSANSESEIEPDESAAVEEEPADAEPTGDEHDDEAAGHDDDDAANHADDEVHDDAGHDDDADQHEDDDEHADEGHDGEGHDGDGDDDHGHEPEGELLTVAPDGTPEIGTVVEGGSAIPPGTYMLNILGEDWRLTVEDDSLRFGGSDPVLFGVGTDALADNAGFIGMLKTVGIVPPREVGIHQEHDPIVPDVTIDIPADLETWLDAVPQVVVVDSGTETVAGDDARWYQLTVEPAAGQTFHCPFGDHCAGFVVHSNSGVTVLAPTIDVTVWQLDARPDIMPWVQVEDSANTPAAQEAMRTVLAGLAPA